MRESSPEAGGDDRRHGDPRDGELPHLDVSAPREGHPGPRGANRRQAKQEVAGHPARVAEVTGRVVAPEQGEDGQRRVRQQGGREGGEQQPHHGSRFGRHAAERGSDHGEKDQVTRGVREHDELGDSVDPGLQVGVAQTDRPRDVDHAHRDDAAVQQQPQSAARVT